LFTSKAANNFAGLKHETQCKSSVFYCCVLSIIKKNKKIKRKACGAIAPHCPNMDPPMFTNP